MQSKDAFFLCQEMIELAIYRTDTKLQTLRQAPCKNRRKKMRVVLFFEVQERKKHSDLIISTYEENSSVII